MQIRFSRELKSPREEVATIVMSWNPSDQTEDNAAAIVAAVTDMAEQYIRMIKVRHEAEETKVQVGNTE